MLIKINKKFSIIELNYNSDYDRWIVALSIIDSTMFNISVVLGTLHLHRKASTLSKVLHGEDDEDEYEDLLREVVGSHKKTPQINPQ